MAGDHRQHAFTVTRGLAVSAAALAALVGAASAEERTYPLTGFSKINAATGVSVQVEARTDYSIRANADPKEFERLLIDVKGDTLNIRRKSGSFGFMRSEVRVDVSLPALNGIDASSGASVNARNIESEEIEIDASSGASISAAGTCGSLAVEASSGASINARELRCDNVAANASSGASISAFASGAIAGDASSGGSIKVAGKPAKVSKSTSSGGSMNVGG